jgi:hypothetical protein
LKGGVYAPPYFKHTNKIMAGRPKSVTLKKEPNEGVLADLNTRFVYVLVAENEKRGMVYDGMSNRPASEPKYKPYRNLLRECSILWDGSDGKPAGRRKLRYYDGCNTLFADEQPTDEKTIEKYMANTRQLFFLQGELVCYGYDTMLKKYLDMASFNESSEYRIPSIAPIYRMVDIEKIGEKENEMLDALETALRYAKENSYAKMIIHANYLGIPEIDGQTQNRLSEKSLRSLYRKEASRDPEKFIESYTDRSIEVKYWVEKSIENGTISTSIIPNMACWGSQGTPICDLSGVKTPTGIVDKIVEFSRLAEGEEFVLQLQSLYK